MQKLSVLALMVASLGASATAMAVLPTVALDPVDTNQAAPATATAMPITTMPVTSAAAISAPVANQIQTRILASVVSQDAQGQEVLSPINAQTRLASGNIVEYRGYLTNNSPDRVRTMKVTMAIPANMELVSINDVLPERAYGSMDGANFQYMPLKTNIGGVLQDLPTSYYKAVQWDVPGLGLNEVAMVKYRLKVK